MSFRSSRERFSVSANAYSASFQTELRFWLQSPQVFRPHQWVAGDVPHQWCGGVPQWETVVCLLSVREAHQCREALVLQLTSSSMLRQGWRSLQSHSMLYGWIVSYTFLKLPFLVSLIKITACLQWLCHDRNKGNCSRPESGMKTCPDLFRRKCLCVAWLWAPHVGVRTVVFPTLPWFVAIDSRLPVLQEGACLVDWQKTYWQATSWTEPILVHHCHEFTFTLHQTFSFGCHLDGDFFFQMDKADNPVSPYLSLWMLCIEWIPQFRLAVHFLSEVRDSGARFSRAPDACWFIVRHEMLEQQWYRENFMVKFWVLLLRVWSSWVDSRDDETTWWECRMNAEAACCFIAALFSLKTRASGLTCS